MFPVIDLRSDTVTLPPPGMRQAIAAAELGDDVYGEDPTVNRLERIAADILGKEASILVPSGTMANLLAILAHCSNRKKLLVGDLSDIWRWEAGGASILGGVVYHPLATQINGEISIEHMKSALYNDDDFQCTPAGLICLENTHCLSGGRVLTLDYLSQVFAFAKQHGLPVHMDGARIFNAAVRLGIDVRRIGQFTDTVAICLSKGLAAPVGSLLAGPDWFTRNVRRLRKMLGGGMRQAGVLAAAGIYAIENMVTRLSEDHAHARLLADGLAHIAGIQVDNEHPETNIVFWRLADPSLRTKHFILELEKEGVRTMELGEGKIRAVTHYGITGKDICFALEAVTRSLTRCREAAWFARKGDKSQDIRGRPIPKLASPRKARQSETHI